MILGSKLHMKICLENMELLQSNHSVVEKEMRPREIDLTAARHIKELRVSMAQELTVNKILNHLFVCSGS